MKLWSFLELIISMSVGFHLVSLTDRFTLNVPFEAKVKETGVTVHFVDRGIDTGPVILQRKLQVLSGETLESLEKRIHGVEYELYPRAIQMLIDGKLKVAGRDVYCDGKPLTALVE